jgi:RNA polymerase sigma-70 factor (ECF subfamily)
MVLIIGGPQTRWQKPPVRTKIFVTRRDFLTAPGLNQTLTEMIARMTRLDQSALAEFYDQTSSLVFRLAQRILNNTSAAEEVTLDVYLQVWTQAADYKPSRGAPTTWLIMMARSRAIDSLRSRKNELLEEPIATTAHFVDGAPNAEQTAVANGRQELVQDALAALSPKYREAIELAFYSGLSHRDIAEKLEQPLGTVKSWIRNGMLQIRERLQAYGNAI